MDILLQSAQEFQRLLNYQYHFVIGRKGKLREFTISFDEADFHHLAGLHKLRDIAQFQTGKRSALLKDILAGKLTVGHAHKSSFFSEMEPRLKPLANLEHFLDSNNIIFHYNAKVQAFSLIQADYLLQNDFAGHPVYLFLAKRKDSETQVCRTFFPKTDKDYTESQPRYTLLKKEKMNIITEENIVQYDRLTLQS